MSNNRAKDNLGDEEIKRDRKLIRRIIAGDHNAYRDLFELYIERVINLAYGYTRSHEEAEDISHDVFLSIWESRGSLKIHGSVAGYLFRATRNRSLNSIRRDKISSKWKLAESFASSGDPGYNANYNLGPANIDNEELSRKVREAISKLPPRLKEILLLHKEQGMSYDQIATTLGVKLSTIPVQMSRALKRLHELLNTLP